MKHFLCFLLLGVSALLVFAESENMSVPIRIVITKQNTQTEYLSLHSLLQKNIDLEHSKIYINDFFTQTPVAIKEAFFVVDFSKEKFYRDYNRADFIEINPKIAFSSLDNAKKFVAKYGGKIENFDFTLLLAQEDFSENEKLFLNFRLKNGEIERGERTLQIFCPQLSYKKDFLDREELDREFAKYCVSLTDAQKEEINFYLSQKNNTHTLEEHLDLKNQKCPVCGMFVEYYPSWVVYLQKQDKKIFFDGVKDLKHFVLNPKKYQNNVLENYDIIVRDYYTLDFIDGKKAYYVIHSEILGPMGKEILSFKNKQEAQQFIKEHLGEIIEFKDITQEVLETLE